MKLQIVALALALMAAGAAQAQTAPPALIAATVPTSHPQGFSLLPVAGGMAFTDAEADALRTGVARTSVDGRLSNRLTSSIGFLCGLHPSVGHEGAAAMRGDDPQGRFLGAKLSLAFR